MQNETSTDGGRDVNTLVAYRYSDANNNKRDCRVIVAGTLDPADVAPHLDSEGFFLAGQVGLPRLQLDFAQPGDDHGWHRFDTDETRPPADRAAWVAWLATALTPTAAEPTEEVTAAELRDAFAAAGRGGWDDASELAAVRQTWEALGFDPDTGAPFGATGRDEED